MTDLSCSCGDVDLMVLGQFSDIWAWYYVLQISENWPRTIRATSPQLPVMMYEIVNENVVATLNTITELEQAANIYESLG